jgi:hypothetical protein
MKCAPETGSSIYDKPYAQSTGALSSSTRLAANRRKHLGPMVSILNLRFRLGMEIVRSVP